jgi:signal transduction histidine kinase
MGGQTAPYIEIGLRGRENDRLVFFIKDNGMGIVSDHYELIFGLFNKLDAKSEGTGVGLALVKRIIETHSCRIWVESKTGMGSTFYFTLPSPSSM